jgi:signal transduction histidine kinase
VIVEMNPAFEQSLDRSVASRSSLRLSELVRPQDRNKTELLLRDLLDSRRDGIGIEARGAGYGQVGAKWTAWRQAGQAGEPDYALLIAEPSPVRSLAEGALQTQRWESIGRLAVGIVHDFNNLLTGVTLYCDLLLSQLEAGDRRRRYAEEIRSAIAQATGLVRQLVSCARPAESTSPRLSNINEIIYAMRDLLTRLIGDDIILELRLDPALGAIRMVRAEAQQILLNLVLNARDALPRGGTITVETSNCGFQPVTAKPLNPPVSFPCILLMVKDNGEGMNAETRRHLFEPFFTTKTMAKGSGLGLTTVSSIVNNNHGLIHFESEPGQGTRAMVMFPKPAQSAVPDSSDTPLQDSIAKSISPFQNDKESLL